MLKSNRAALLAATVVAAVVLVVGLVVTNTRSSDSSSTTAASVTASTSSLPTNDKFVTVTYPAGRSLGVRIIGDSLAAGIFADTPAQSWAQLTVNELRKYGPVDDLIDAAPGKNTAEIAERVKAIPSTTDLIFIEVGTNDNGNTPREGATSINTLTANYALLIKKVHEAAPNAKIMCLGAWLSPATAKSIDLVIADQCGKIGAPVVNLSTLYADTANHGPVGSITALGPRDNFHPNNAGHRAIFDRINSLLIINGKIGAERS